MRKAIIASVAMLTMSVTPAIASDKKKQSTATKPMSDQAFVMDAARANMAEVEIGKLAETRSLSPEVKTFAKNMVTDHQKALDNLKTVARNEKITWPSVITPRDKALEVRLEKLSGHAFDRAYMRAMVRDHRRDVAEFQTESTKAASPDVRQYAASTLPILENHLKVAENTEKSVTHTSSKPSSKKSVS